MKIEPKVTIPYEFWATNQNKKNTTSYDNTIACQTSMEEAVFIRRFIWYYEDKKKKGRGWVYIRPRIFALRVGMSLYTFRKIVKKWERLKLVETKCEGRKYLKYYHLNEDRMAEYLSTIYEKSKVIENNNLGYRKQQPLRLSKTTTSLNDINNASKNNTAARTKSPGQQSIKPLILHPDKAKDTPEHRLSVQLFKILRPIVEPNADGMPKKEWEIDEKTGKKKRTGPRDWRDWHKAFRSKLNEGRHDEQEISRILKWYGENIRERYTPQLYSANTFCKELCRVIRQMKTGNEDTMKSRWKKAQQNGSCEWTEKGIRYKMYPDGSYTGWKGQDIVDTGYIGSKGDTPDNFDSEVS